jgi:hypothetical protein
MLFASCLAQNWFPTIVLMYLVSCFSWYVVGKKSVYAAIHFDQYLLRSLLCSPAPTRKHHSTHFHNPRYVFHVLNGRKGMAETQITVLLCFAWRRICVCIVLLQPSATVPVGHGGILLHDGGNLAEGGGASGQAMGSHADTGIAGGGGHQRVLRTVMKHIPLLFPETCVKCNASHWCSFPHLWDYLVFGNHTFIRLHICCATLYMKEEHMLRSTLWTLWNPCAESCLICKQLLTLYHLALCIQGLVFRLVSSSYIALYLPA